MSDDATGRILAAIGQLQTGIGQLETGIGQLETRIGQQLETRIGQLRTDLMGEVASLTAALMTELAGTRAGIMERIDRQQARLDSIEELLTMGLGHADDAHTSAAAAQASATAASTGGRINSEQIAILRDLYRKLDARVRQLEEKE